MKNSKKRLLTLTVNHNVKIKVDKLLEDQFTAWRNNYKGQQVQQSSSPSKKNENQLLMEYIRSLYREYGISDPYEKYRNKKSGKKVYQTSSSRQIPNQPEIKMNSSIKLPIRLKESYIPHRQTLDSSIQKHFIPQGSQFQRSTVYRTYNKVIDYNYQSSRQNSIQTIKNNKNTTDRSAYTTPRNTINHVTFQHREQFPTYGSTNLQRNSKMFTSTQLQHSKKSTNKLGRKNNQKLNQLKSSIISQCNDDYPQIIKQSYRYCLGCQQAIIQANIRPHEQQCTQLQKLYSWNLEEILGYIQNKINVIKQRMELVTGNIHDADSESIRSYSQIIQNQAEQISKTGKLTQQFQNNYDRALIIGKRWINVLEEINKIRWFVKMREEIMRKYKM